MLRFLIIFSILFLSMSAMAFNLDWSGVYRVESLLINNSEADAIKRNKSYINHHLVLSPKIHAADGFTVFSRFHLFNNSDLPNSQFGEFFGGSSARSGTTFDNTDTLADRQVSENLEISQLYLSYTNEFVSILAGRAPLQFGLGMTHNAGNGRFDHWYDSRDLLAAKFEFGNLSLTPMYGKVLEGETDVGDDVWEYIIQLDYDNVEAETAFGLMWKWRRAGSGGNDSDGPFSSTKVDGFEGEDINFYLKRGWGDLQFGLEGGFKKGGTGTTDANNNEINLDGFGLAVELDYQKEGSKWAYQLKTGFAGGDDPNTTDSFEGFFFDRNYDIGFLLFNHVLGQFDLFSSSLSRGEDINGGTGSNFNNAGSVPDVEVVSNVIYFAPGFRYQLRPTVALGSKLVYAFLQENTVLVNSTATDVETDVGFEVDFSLDYQPHDKFNWITEIGLLFPGAAFEGGSNNFDANFGYGISTKAAVSF